MSKNYVLDTNVLLDNEKCIEILSDNQQNKVFIPATVIEELDALKKNGGKRHQVQRVVEELEKYKDIITIIHNGTKHESNDNIILREIECNGDKVDSPIFVTNDKMLRFKADKKGIKAEPFKESNPFKSESQRYTGFVNIDEGETLVENCFYWKEGRLFFNDANGNEKAINYENQAWKVAPRTPYQNAAMDLMLNDSIDVVTVQSEAGFGKSFITLACMFQMVLEKKKFRKMYIIRPNVEIGNALGFLPGSMDEKMEPYFRPMRDLMEKLHHLRPANKVWKDAESIELATDRRKMEMMPINFLRGMNIDNAVVMIEEAQNLTREELRTVLSRMGENVKVICTGDVRQIDNPHLNQDNNGLNWMVKLFKGSKNYGHIVLGGNKSRGPIADLAREKGL